MKLTEKVAYIKGLMEGMKLDESKDEIKVLHAMADLLEDLALTVSDLEDSCDEAAELIDVLDEDLGNVEEMLYGEDACDCCDCDNDSLDDEDFFEVSCPTCGETICLTEDTLYEGEISCPKCGEKLEFDIDDEFLDDPDEKK